MQPVLDDDSGLSERVEDFAVEQLVAKARVEALDVTVIRYVGRRCLTCSADLQDWRMVRPSGTWGTGST
jgi:hypothetical protein